MLKVFVEKFFNSSVVDATHLLARRRLHPRSGFLLVFHLGGNRFQLGEYLGAALATCGYQEAVTFGSKQFREDKVKRI
jgi:hypothetical protein